MEQAFLMAWQLWQMQQWQQQMQASAALSPAMMSDWANLGFAQPRIAESAPEGHLDTADARSPGRSRSRSRSPRLAQVSTPEIATPEASFPESPRGAKASEPPTPEILRRLLVISSEGDSSMSRAQAVERLDDLAKAARARLQTAN